LRKAALDQNEHRDETVLDAQALRILQKKYGSFRVTSMQRFSSAP